jgi:hypothetical protein
MATNIACPVGVLCKREALNLSVRVGHPWRLGGQKLLALASYGVAGHGITVCNPTDQLCIGTHAPRDRCHQQQSRQDTHDDQPLNQGLTSGRRHDPARFPAARIAAP